MKIQYMSDLHLEFAPFEVEQAGDVLVLAGDIISGSEKSRERFEQMLDGCQDFDAVLMVIGNHEGYHTSLDEAVQYLMSVEYKFPNFYLLDLESVGINGVTFRGCPLWSNPQDPHTQWHARRGMNDYRLIDGWTYEHHCSFHQDCLDWLNDNVKEGDVVITHFPPTQHAINENRYSGDVLNAWYANDLELMIESTKPAVWISGHTHNKWEEVVGKTKVLGNCRGYYRYGGNEVQEFNPIQVVEI